MTVQDPCPARSSVMLHWLVALGVLGMLAFGYWLSTLPSGPAKTEYVQLHKSFGMIVFTVALTRIAWRARTGFPASRGSDWERLAARLAHRLMLTLTVLVPLSGVVRSLAYARPVKIFGLTAIPQLLAIKNEPLNAFAGAAHDSCAFALAALIVVHLAATAKHHFLDRDDTLTRMRPALRAPLKERPR